VQEADTDSHDNFYIGKKKEKDVLEIHPARLILFLWFRAN
jgi:hypothetical protein